jgi:diguanylate cyclase (GGDEF)-like protein
VDYGAGKPGADDEDWNPVAFSVLLIDDDEDEAFLVRQLLGSIEPRSWSVDWAPTAERGREWLEMQVHDVYLLDYRLGAETGLDLLRLASDRGLRKPMVMLTGQGNSEVDALALDLGAANYLTKEHLSAENLDRTLRYAIRQSRIMEGLRREEERLRDLALHDDLTGLWNRRALIGILDHSIALARRQDEPLSIAIADLDGFKGINDRNGHDAGDAVLEAFAQILQSNLRASDIAGRWGGDEFCVIPPGTDAFGAAAVLARVRAAVRRHFLSGDLQAALTATCGIAEHRKNGATSTALLRASDLALYEGKRRGGNQIRVAGCAPAARKPV